MASIDGRETALMLHFFRPSKYAVSLFNSLPIETYSNSQSLKKDLLICGGSSMLIFSDIFLASSIITLKGGLKDSGVLSFSDGNRSGSQNIMSEDFIVFNASIASALTKIIFFALAM